MCVQVTKTANRFEISSLLEKILLKQIRWCLTFVGLYIYIYLIKNQYVARQVKKSGVVGVISCHEYGACDLFYNRVILNTKKGVK